MKSSIVISLGLVALLSTASLTDAATSHIDDAACTWSTRNLGCIPKEYCKYRYDKGDLTLDQSCRVAPEANKAPQQIHLAYAGIVAGSEMTVSWLTYDEVTDPALWIGSSESNLAQVSTTVIPTQYYKDTTYSTFHYHATASGLTANTKYYYKVGSVSNADLQSDVYTFTTAKAATDDSTFKVAVVGDFGDGDNSVDTTKYMNTLGSIVDFVYHIGDISYADTDYLVASQVTGFFYEEVYNKWMNSLSGVMSAVPYMVTVGNHEAECHSPYCQISNDKKTQLGNYTAFNHRFKMPSSESGGVLNMWHSFNHGPLHITSLSSETDYPNAPTNEYTTTHKNGNFGDQLAWVEQDLQAANENRDNVPWIIVGMHRPIYFVGESSKDAPSTEEALAVQASFEELFIKYKVDVVITGHQHCYERQLPIARNTPMTEGVSADKKTYTNPQAPVYIISGAGGNVEGLEDNAGQSATWNAFADYTHFGVSILQVTRSSLTWDYVDTATGDVLDSFTMAKK